MKIYDNAAAKGGALNVIICLKRVCSLLYDLELRVLNVAVLTFVYHHYHICHNREQHCTVMLFVAASWTVDSCVARPA